MTKATRSSRIPFHINSPSRFTSDLPGEFNSGLVDDCHHLNIYTDMYPHVANRDLGQPLQQINGVGPGCWFSTHQFIAEMIFMVSACVDGSDRRRQY